MKRPFFSIIIPTLNEETYLPKLLTSLADQTIRNFEVIVVDGSSKDRTVAIARRFAKKLRALRVIVSKKASLPLQRNMGARVSRGEWLVFVDADSTLLPYAAERMLTYVRNTEVSVFTTWFCPDTDIQKDATTTLFWMIVLESSIFLKRQLAPGPLTGVTRKAYDTVGGYDEAHAFQEDMDFSLRLYNAGYKLHMIRETLYVLSLRRLRRQGTFKVAQQYMRGALSVLLFKKPLSHMPDYIMGGQEYR